jgi:hypothetical protein
MGELKLKYYEESVKSVKQNYYLSLPEKAKRHFLGQEYCALGTGSQRYLSAVFDCSRDTIRKGYREVLMPNFQVNYSEQRVKGGGRKKKKKPFLI